MGFGPRPMDKSTIFFLDDLFPTEKLLLKEQFQGLTKTHYANLINLSWLLFQKKIGNDASQLKKNAQSNILSFRKTLDTLINC